MSRGLIGETKTRVDDLLVPRIPCPDAFQVRIMYVTRRIAGFEYFPWTNEMQEGKNVGRRSAVIVAPYPLGSIRDEFRRPSTSL